MRKVRHEKKLSAQRASTSKPLRKTSRLASKTPPSEADTQSAKATLKTLDIENWARQNLSVDCESYIVVDQGVCPLECVLKRAETLRTGTHRDILEDPRMIDFVNLLLDSADASTIGAGAGQRNGVQQDANVNDFSIELGPLVRGYLEQRASHPPQLTAPSNHSFFRR